MHQRSGNAAILDGSVQQTSDSSMRKIILNNQDNINYDLIIP
jgi:hypothetical protein